MNSEDAKFIRHYDTLLWTVSSIFLVAIGVLLKVYIDYEKFRIFIALLGLLLTLALVWFAAGFRDLRFTYPIKDKEKLQRLFPQWGIYVIVFGAIGTFWIYLSNEAFYFPFLWLAIWVFMAGYLYVIFKLAESP